MSQMIELRVPDIGDYKDVPVIELLVAVGDTIAVDTALVTLESDKATMDVPSTAAGRIAEILVKTGDRVSEGSVIARLEISDAAAPSAESSVATASSAPAATPAVAAGRTTHGLIFFSAPVDGAVTAVPRLNLYFYLIYKLSHLLIF